MATRIQLKDVRDIDSNLYDCLNSTNVKVNYDKTHGILFYSGFLGYEIKDEDFELLANFLNKPYGIDCNVNGLKESYERGKFEKLATEINFVICKDCYTNLLKYINYYIENNINIEEQKTKIIAGIESIFCLFGLSENKTIENNINFLADCLNGYYSIDCKV